MTLSLYEELQLIEFQSSPELKIAKVLELVPLTLLVDVGTAGVHNVYFRDYHIELVSISF